MSLSCARRINEACEHYETAWRAGRALAIEDIVTGFELADQPCHLGEPIALDQVGYANERGESPAPEEYEDRFPDHRQVVSAVFDVTVLRATPAVAREDGWANEGPLPTLSFGDYEVIEEIARGGMGVVYKARHLST